MLVSDNEVCNRECSPMTIFRGLTGSGGEFWDLDFVPSFKVCFCGKIVL